MVICSGQMAKNILDLILNSEFWAQSTVFLLRALFSRPNIKEVRAKVRSGKFKRKVYVAQQGLKRLTNWHDLTFTNLRKVGVAWLVVLPCPYLNIWLCLTITKSQILAMLPLLKSEFVSSGPEHCMHDKGPLLTMAAW